MSNEKDWTVKGKQKQKCVSLPPELLAQLKLLSAKTRVPEAAYFREALVDLLKKYAGTLRKAK